MAVNRAAQSLEAAPNLLEILTREQGTTMTIELAGEWDLAGAPGARQVIAGVLAGHPECVVLDLSRLAFIDSSGVHAMLELAGHSSSQNVRLMIIPGPPAVQGVFEITGLTEQLPFIDKPLPANRWLIHQPPQRTRPSAGRS